MAATRAATTSARPSPRSALIGRHLSPVEQLLGRLAPARRRTRRVDGVDLVQDGDVRRAGRGDRLGDVAVAAAGRLGGVQHEQGGVDLGQGGVDRRLHAARERVEGPLKAGQVEQHELEVVAGDDPADAPPRGLRMVR